MCKILSVVVAFFLWTLANSTFLGRDSLPLVLIYIYISRLTVVSREAKKKQHACASSGPRDHYSELFTRMAALKF